MSTAYCFDLDGTISTLEILPCIAAELGVSDEISSLTRLTMDGHIPFPESLRLRALILGQVAIERVHQTIDMVPLDPHLVSFLSEYTKDCFIITGNLDLWIAPLLDRLGCNWVSSQAIHVEGRLRVEHVLDKSQAIRQIRSAGTHSRIVAVGDGANDIPMFQEADLAVAYGGVHPPAPSAAAAASIIVHDSKTLCTLLKAL